MAWDCPGCKTRIRIELEIAPSRSGAMTTIDCPVCGASKMIPDVADRIFHQKEGLWVETKPHSFHA
jgi:hypothetical protein